MLISTTLWISDCPMKLQSRHVVQMSYNTQKTKVTSKFHLTSSFVIRSNFIQCYFFVLPYRLPVRYSFRCYGGFFFFFLLLLILYMLQYNQRWCHGLRFLLPPPLFVSVVVSGSVSVLVFKYLYRGTCLSFFVVDYLFVWHDLIGPSLDALLLLLVALVSIPQSHHICGFTNVAVFGPPISMLAFTSIIKTSSCLYSSCFETCVTAMACREKGPAYWIFRRTIFNGQQILQAIVRFSR